MLCDADGSNRNVNELLTSDWRYYPIEHSLHKYLS